MRGPPPGPLCIINSSPAGMSTKKETVLPPTMQMAILVGLGVLAFFIIILTVYIGGNWLLARFRKPKPPSEESIRRYRERLLNPRWDELQEHFGLTIPQTMKDFYKQTTLLTTQNVVFREANGKEWHVAGFYPADTETSDAIWPDLKKSKIFPFAFDSFGDCYYVELTDQKSDRCPVMYYHHDGDDVELVSSSLDEFLKWHPGT
jgi:SMI1 / KNR4 family (SUKH-1)